MAENTVRTRLLRDSDQAVNNRREVNSRTSAASEVFKELHRDAGLSCSNIRIDERGVNMGVYEIITGITKKRRHSDMYGCNEKTLDRIEHALGIKLETWQSEYILSQGITYPHEGRRTGKTLAYQIKTLLTAHNDITIYGNEEQYYVDEIHGSVYEKNYVTDLARLSEYLRKAGIGVPKVTLKLNVKRRREDGMRWN